MKKWIHDYLSFSKKERIGLLVLLILLGAFVTAPYFFANKPQPLPNEITGWTDKVVYTQMRYEDKEEGKNSLPTHRDRVYFFPFDPNTANSETFKKLGFTYRNIQTIYNYRNKGGRFKVATDLQKIWGIRQELVDSLLPYIRIKAVEPMQWDNQLVSGVKAYKPFSQKVPQKIDINTAEQADWEQLPYIGPVLATRILKYRNHLGGFSAIEEIRKTYGLTDSVFAVIQPFLQLSITTIGSAKQIHSAQDRPSINTASEGLLVKAGVDPAIASAIVLYRKQYGLFSRFEDLRKIVFIQNDQYEQLIKQVRL